MTPEGLGGAPRQVALELCDCAASTTYFEENRWFFIVGIVEGTARTQTFVTGESELTVEQYFLEKQAQTALP